jgi:hypothetical protein
MTDATKHMPTDPNARALTIGGKSVGGAPRLPWSSTSAATTC